MTADGVTIGVATFSVDKGARLGSSSDSFGYNSYATLWHQNLRVPYGKPYQAGDIVSVHLDFVKQRLRFYVNKKCLSCAWSSEDLVQKQLYLAATLSYPGDSITIMRAKHKNKKK